MAGDVTGLLDHLGIDGCDIMGYSSARMTAWLATGPPERLRRQFRLIEIGLIEGGAAPAKTSPRRWRHR